MTRLLTVGGRGSAAAQWAPVIDSRLRGEAGRAARLLALPLASSAVGCAPRRRRLAGGGGCRCDWQEAAGARRPPSGLFCGRRRRGRPARTGGTGTHRQRLRPPAPARRSRSAAAGRRRRRGAWECGGGGGGSEPSPSARPPWSRGGDSAVPQRPP